MDIKEFATDFMDNVQTSVELEGNDFEEQLTTDLLDYVMDTGEVNAPEICIFKHKRAGLHAYDFNEETGSLDLFRVVTTDTLLGKINKNKVESAYNELVRTFNATKDGSLIEDVENRNDPIFEVYDFIQSIQKQVVTLRVFLLTNGIVDVDYEPTTVECDGGLIMEQHIWDMQRLYQQECIRSGKEKIEIDFPTTYSTEIQCLKMLQNSPDVDAYLAIMPGITLAKIYNKYKQGLLEKNVRTFLQFRSKVNQGIRKTLLETPDMFFSYNNGISTTASEITVNETEEGLFITNLYDWQIVNGGQTTASIAATYNEKSTDLTKVFVPVKISVIHDEEKAKDIIPSISSSSNSQTAIKQSDFSSNDPYLVQLENLSRSEWVPNGHAASELKWYFERTRGQYLDDLSHQRGINEKLFRTNYPKNHKLTKTDIAKYEMAWEQKPDSVCKGGEKTFSDFVKLIKTTKPNVTPLYYHRMIAKAILFANIDKLVKAKNLGGYKSNMNAYLLASVSSISKRMLDLDYIWEKQKIQPALEKLIDKLIPTVWEHIVNKPNVNVNEWSKKADCWNSLKLALDEFDEIDDSLKMKPEAMVDETITQAQQDKIQEAWNVSADKWFGFAKWAKENDQLTPMERKKLYTFGTFKSRGKMFTLKQAVEGMQIINKLGELGCK